MGYWIICLASYEYDGEEISKGRMMYHTSKIPVISNRWRAATKTEIDGMKKFKGKSYYLTPKP